MLTIIDALRLVAETATGEHLKLIEKTIAELSRLTDIASLSVTLANEILRDGGTIDHGVAKKIMVLAGKPPPK